MKKVYAERRKAIMKGKNTPSIVIFYSGRECMRSEDENYDFSVNRNFFYFTGIERENMILVLKKLKDNTVQEELYIERYDEVMAKWVGGRMKEEEATSISGIEQIFYIEDFELKLNGYVTQCRAMEKLRVYLDLWRYNVEQSDTPAHICATLIQRKYPSVCISDIYGDTAALRSIKSEEELDKLMKAQESTRVAIEAMMSHARPGMNECEIEGAFDFALSKQGIKEHAFPSIVAGGERAMTLHYRDNNQVVEDGELILVDLGSASGHYCADISRTFPVNGKFTKRQKQIYNIVIGAQDLVIDTAKPGMTLKALDGLVIAYYKQQLAEIGLLSDGKTVADYYYHGVSHHLGLDTHDVYSPDTEVLHPGMVITVEPGLYLLEEKIGIRVENDILITEGKARDLSKNIMKTVEDIEKFMEKNYL